MPTAIQFLRTSEPNLRPNPVNLSDGMPMFGLNETDPGLYFKLQDETLCKIGPCAISAVAPNTTPTGQAGNTVGEFWLDTSSAIDQLKVWNGTTWVVTNSPTSSTANLDQVTTEGNTTTNAISVGTLTASNLTYPSADGVAGQYLQTDGSGNLSWGSGSTVPTPGGVDTQMQFNNAGVLDGTSLLVVSGGTDLIFGGDLVPSTNNVHGIGSNGQRLSDLFTTVLDVSDLGADAGTY